MKVDWNLEKKRRQGEDGERRREGIMRFDMGICWNGHETWWLSMLWECGAKKIKEVRFSSLYTTADGRWPMPLGED